MKKLLLLAVLVLISFSANAQLNVTSTTTNSLEKVATLSMEWVWLYQDSDGFYLTAKSQNQFDDWVWLRLGSDKDSCLRSLSDLQTILESENKVITVKGKTESIRISSANILGSKQIWMKTEGNCDYAPVTSAAIKKAIKYFNKL